MRLHVFIFLMLLWGCRSVTPMVPRNDTSEVLARILDTGLLLRYIPDYSYLKNAKDSLRDTFLIRFDSVLIGRLPPGFKMLSKSDICAMATKVETDSSGFRNFLEIQTFERVHDTITIDLRNECVIPLFDKYGRKHFRKLLFDTIPGVPCWFGFLCGGNVMVQFVRDSLGWKDSILLRTSD